MYKKCKNEIVTINYAWFGNVQYSTIMAITYNPADDRLIIAWNDGECVIHEDASTVCTFITFEDGTEWELKRA